MSMYISLLVNNDKDKVLTNTFLIYNNKQFYFQFINQIF